VATQQIIPSDSTAANDDAQSLIRFLKDLRDRHAAGESDEPAGVAWRAHLSGLHLGLAALRDAVGEGAGDSRPLQIGIIGPTQVGKSTLVNLLLAATAARVSPLAGFTAHAQGFLCGNEASGGPGDVVGSRGDAGWAANLFPDWERHEADDLTTARMDRFALRGVESQLHKQFDCDGVVVWDTPDFDSTRAQAHQRAVLEVVALSDVLVLALSKEKYSDLSVWELLRLIEPLERSLVICLNKTSSDGAALIEESLRSKLDAAGGVLAAAPIVTLPYVSGIESDPDRLESAVEPLRVAIAGIVHDAGGDKRPARAVAFVRRHWDAWLEPVVAEHAARTVWGEMVDAAAEEALASYGRDYQDHPQRFDAFKRAIAELLRLLELPFVADAFSRARELVTWPARQLFAARARWSQRGRAASVLHGAGSEEIVLREAVAKMLVQLARDAARRSSANQPGRRLWSAISDRLESDEVELTRRADAAIARYRQAFEPEIQQAAQNLYNELQRHPAKLNTLRAARATADAAAVVFAVKTAGLGAEALLLGPAMVSVTSMLTEGALGSYMQKVAGDLKRRQLERLRAQVFVDAVQADLYTLANALSGDGIFGISRERMDTAVAALSKLERANA
jgi:GTPase SAR1 family protein